MSTIEMKSDLSQKAELTANKDKETAKEQASFSIGTVSRILGLSTHALRVWEKRYDLKLAKRDKSGRRVYFPSEIEKLKLIKQALDSGYQISDVANLSVSELTQLNGIETKTTFALKNNQINVLVYGDLLARLCFQLRLVGKYQVAPSLTSIVETAQEQSVLVSAVWLDIPTISDEIEELLYRVKFSLAHRSLVVFSNGANDDQAKRLTEANITLVNDVPTSSVLENLLVKLSVKTGGQKNEPDTLTDDQIEALLKAESNIYCECPRHLADLYGNVSEFIRYTEHCEITSPKDSAVHQFMNNRLYAIRKQIVSLTLDVASMDGLNLENTGKKSH